MASRIFQLGIVFTIGLNFGPLFAVFAWAIGITDIPLSLQLKDPEDVIVRKGQSATLRCFIKSSSTELQITWLHNNNPIPFNDSRRVIQNDGSLFIKKVVNGKKMSNITGQYRCVVKNDIGALISSPAKLIIASFDREFNKQPTNQSVPEFQPVVLFCNIHSIPTAQIRWEFNTSALPHNTRYVPLPNGALLITKTLSSDEGFYRCIATNSILKKTKYSKIVKLTVESSQKMNTEAPAFLPLDILPNKTVLIGDNVTFYCALTGWPIPSIQWLNNKSIVISNSSVLELKNITTKDKGDYLCIGSNNNGQIKQKYCLDVHQKPYFNTTPVSRIFPLARTVRLDCQSLGIPEPKIRWLKNGVSLPNESRIKKQSTGLVFSHTFTHDNGIYQCVAENSAGTSWVAAQILLTSINKVSPPENVQCRSYDEKNICLTWRPPINVSPQAYSIYSNYIANGSEIPGPEYVTNLTNHLVYGLNPNTNYTFYVRLYSKSASDKSEVVTCETRIAGNRNLQITPLSDTSVELKWSYISTDVPCDGTNALYKVQWRRKDRFSINTNNSVGMTHVVSSLLPSNIYEFRVTSVNYKNDHSPWVPFKLNGINDSLKYDTIDSDIVPVLPKHFEGIPISSTSINVTWSNFNVNSKFYTVCYKDVKEDKNCEDSVQLKSYLNSILIEKLQPNTTYEFKVRAHYSDDNFTEYSYPIEIQTLKQVPSTVFDLKYKIINETTVCLRWQAPLHINGKLISYDIFYAPKRHFKNWTNITIPAVQTKSDACWLAKAETISYLLNDLKSDQQYSIFVTANTDIGLSSPTLPIVVTTNPEISINLNSDENENTTFFGSENSYYYLIIGISMGAVLPVICIGFLCSFLIRMRGFKRRPMNEPRTTASNNYHRSVVYHAPANRINIHERIISEFSDEYRGRTPEVEDLLADDQPHIPSFALGHLDTKGSNDFPNGNINGSAKPYMNGQVSGDNMHITENPQYFVLESNGHIGRHLEEDSNSNIKASDFQDLHKICKDSSTPMKVAKYYNTSLNSVSDIDDSLNSTQITCVTNNSLILPENNYKRISPIIGPNG